MGIFMPTVWMRRLRPNKLEDAVQGLRVNE